MTLRTRLELQKLPCFFDLVKILKFKMWKGDGGVFLLLRVQHGGEYISTMFGCV